VAGCCSRATRGWNAWPSTQVVTLGPTQALRVVISERCAKAEGVDVVTFKRGERKDDVMQRYLAGFDQEEGLLFIGKAQEKASVDSDTQVIPSLQCQSRRRQRAARGRCPVMT
jgi:acetyl-CoA carboxylase carboxyltransferase component